MGNNTYNSIKKNYSILINLINIVIMKIQFILKPTKLMAIEDSITENRFDINLRVEFLQKVINNGKKINETRYYKFIETPGP